jgi:hypothetical protein
MSKLTNIAIAEIGNIEDPGNKTKYGKWFGFDGVAWCGMFVSWCFAQSGKQLPKMGFTKGFASCQFAFEYFKKNEMLTEDPIENDIVLFDWNGDARFDHTGIYLSKIDDNYFWCIEGNTSLKNQSNGGMVMKRKRHKKFAKFARYGN